MLDPGGYRSHSTISRARGFGQCPERVRFFRPSRYALTVAALAFLCLSGQTAGAAALIPPGDNPGGQSAATSVQQWTKWAYSFDNDVDGGNPITDNTGEFQNKKQTFPLFYFGGAVEEGVARSFSLQHGKPLAIPLINITCVSSDGFDCTDPSIVDLIDTLMASVDHLFLSVDGMVIVNANTADEVDMIEDQFLLSSGFFDLPVAPNNWGGEPEGIWPDSFNTGYYAFVSELPPGEHQIIYRGGISEEFSVGVDATVTVVPEPPTLLILLGGLASLGLVARSRRFQSRC